MTQSESILHYIQTYGSITPADALREFSCMRLAARIYDLENAGHKIKSELIETKNRNGESVRVASYSLEMELAQGSLFT